MTAPESRDAQSGVEEVLNRHCLTIVVPDLRAGEVDGPTRFGCECDPDLRFDVTNDQRAHVAAALGSLIAGERAKALRVVRLVEQDMAECALLAWRSADARRGLSDHGALLVYADALTRWSERLRMAFVGEDCRADREQAATATEPGPGATNSPKPASGTSGPLTGRQSGDLKEGK